MWGSVEEKGPIGQVLPDFTVAIDTERLSSSRLAMLKQFAEPVSSQGKRTVLRLTSQSVERGRSVGVTSREIMFLLRHIHGRELPSSVASTVAEWAERFGHGVLQRAAWLRGEPSLMAEISGALDGAEAFVRADAAAILFCQMDRDELAEALTDREIFPSVHRLKPQAKAYQGPETKENGILNQSLRAIYNLYCCLRDGTLNTISDPAAQLYRRLGIQLGVSGRAAKPNKEQQLALRRLAGDRMWDAQMKMIRLYLADQDYSEISGFDPLVSDQVVRELDHLRQPQQVRQRLADYLREMKPLEWTVLLPFARRLRKESPKVIRATRSWDWSYLRRQDRPWEEVEDYWLMHLLTHEFWWLGIVELYSTRAHGPTAFRLTADGLGLLAGEEPEPRSAIVTAPTGWMVLEPRQMTVEEVALLMQFVDTQPLTCQWSVYWDRLSLYDGVSRGIPLSAFTHLLEKHCPEIPGELTKLVAELTHQGERVAVHEGYLLTCRESVLLDSLLAVRSLALCIEERLSPTAAVVYPAAVNRLLRGSERNGIGIDDRTEGPPGHQASGIRD